MDGAEEEGYDDERYQHQKKKNKFAIDHPKGSALRPEFLGPPGPSLIKTPMQMRSGVHLYTRTSA